MTKSALAIIFATTLPLWACDKADSPTSPTQTQAGPPVATGAMTFEGRIDAVSPPDTITISGQRIVVGANTALRASGEAISFSDLQVGAQARVAAESDGATVRATSIDVLGDVGQARRLRGVISGLTRNGDQFQFQADGQRVQGNGSSVVANGSNIVNAGSLANGQTVVIEGLDRSGYTFAKRVDIELQPTSGSGPSPSPGTSPDPGAGSGSGPGSGSDPAPSSPGVTVSGVLSNLSGLCPVLTFPVNGQVVVTSAATAFIGGSCQAIQVGSSVEATGPVVGGQVLATQVTIR